MKHFLFVLLVSIFCIGTSFAREIEYFNKSWAEIKAKAEAEHKYIFIDCYTDWCGWCKTMDKETMHDTGIVALVSDKFIAVKMDMEKGEGVQMAMKYHITGFPTFIFFDPDGNYVYNVAGYEQVKEFTASLNNAIDKSKQFKAPGFSAELNVAFPEFYKGLFAASGQKKIPTTQEVMSFLGQQKDLFSEVSWAIISQCQVNKKCTMFFLDNIDKYRSLYGKDADDKLNYLLNTLAMEATKNKDSGELDMVLQMTDKFVKGDVELTKIYFKVYYYKENKDWDKCTKAMDNYLAKKGYENTEYINAMCRDINNLCEDKVLLKKAAGWMSHVVKLSPAYAYMDTYAAILYKSGQQKDAKQWAGNAITEGKKKGNDVTSAEELLKKINSK